MIPQCKKENLNNASLKLDPSIKIVFDPEVGKQQASWEGCYYYKKGTRVSLHVGVNLETTARSLIYTLPKGFRPLGAIARWGGGADGKIPDKSFMELYPNGEIWVNAPSKFALITVEFDTFN